MYESLLSNVLPELQAVNGNYSNWFLFISLVSFIIKISPIFDPRHRALARATYYHLHLGYWFYLWL